MMEAATISVSSLLADPYAAPAALGGSLLFSLYFINKYISKQKRRSSNLPPVPEVPGWPVIGNLLELKEKKPHKTFKKWADTYGPIYSIKTGASTVIVLNSTEVAKEAMVTRYSSISSRKLSKALTVLTQEKCMVAMSDYDDFHKIVKRYILANVLGPSAQKQHQGLRNAMMDNLSRHFHEHVENHPQEAVDFRKIFESELFGISLKEAIGTDVESIYVPEFATTFSRDDIFQTLVLDPMEGAIEVDWRDFFPFLAWVPNRMWEMKIERMQSRRQAVMNALINEQKKRIASGKNVNCYLDYLLSEGKTLTEKQITMLVWEAIIEAADTILVTTEWAMYELSKHPDIQERLYCHIRDACGSGTITEEHLPQLPYLNAIFHETMRKHSPVPVVPLRYAHEDTQLGGYFVPAGSQIAINLYGCNMDKNQWDDPEDWKPERFLDGNYDPMDLHKTMAFGAGKRVCAGALQATLIGSRAIGRLVQEFEWGSKGGEDNVDTMSLTSRKLYPLHALIKPRAA